MTGLNKKSHFLGTKIRNLRKQNQLTIEDLSVRCMKIDRESAPSVSYLSMIERGKRVPAKQALETIAKVFQKETNWFLDDVIEVKAITPNKRKQSQGGLSGMTLEPSFLFTHDILEIAIPELLSQAGISGSQFAHLLIRAHVERNQNHFPDLEKEAESIGLKRMPISVDEMMQILKSLNIKLKWFKQPPAFIKQHVSIDKSHTVRSVLMSNIIYVNELMESQPTRLKYDLANHIGRKILHDAGDLPEILISGEKPVYNKIKFSNFNDSSVINSQQIIEAWRDFEASFFAGALLCPKVPFRQLLDRNSYEFNTNQLVDVSNSVAIRRMTAVSSYPYWHYLDAYSKGVLKAVYRGNGIPLPWGNMTSVTNPCQNWAVFRMINSKVNTTYSQISIINRHNQPIIYCCESMPVYDIAGKVHVLCAGVDLNPALRTQGLDAQSIAEEIQSKCIDNHGEYMLPSKLKSQLTSVAKILNIVWIERALKNPANIVCSGSDVCPRKPNCYCKK